MPPAAIYSAMATLVVPRPIALVSTISANGVKNLAPFSFFMVGGANPPSLMISPTMDRTGLDKDTYVNIEATGEFVVNLVHFDIVHGMNAASAPHPSDVSEWEFTGLDPLPSERVKPDRVAQSLAHFECRHFQTVAHGTGPNSARYVIGEVLAIHIDESLMAEGRVISPALIARLGGPEYLDLANGETFTLSRPTANRDRG